ncbi:MAG TPA: DUF4301 family protein [Flavobacteriaceae bacterium]
MFSDKDIKQIKSKGLTLQKVMEQINLFETGLPFVTIKDAATIGKGIHEITEETKQHYIDYYDRKRDQISILKFVPASGAATRMFKFLFQFLKDYNVKNESINSYINRNKAQDLSLFFVGLDKFPFYEEVLKKARELHSNYDTLSGNEQKFLFVKTMLDENGLNYGFCPKGLLPFHKYKDHVSTAFEEHLFEAALSASSQGKANLHFTISEKYNHTFDEAFRRIENIVEEKTKTAFDISFSYQKQATDTIAVNLQNEPYRDENNRLVFRPSGHGALLENLNDLHADLIFIKNIDNVVVFKFEEKVAEYKKVLAGMLLEIQGRTFQYLMDLETKRPNEEVLLEIAQFLSTKMNVVISEEFEKYSLKYQRAYLIEKLNRPIRVCGMVKNEGEPGGGPFWVKDEKGTISLQIVESAQIDKKNKYQKDIFKNATHFNPVDLVCGVKDYKGNKFDLTKFVNPKTAFIAMKTKTGNDLKALELPGLWNGSMDNWNTIFVEVPLITFNPVKTVNDLLKAPHQAT